MHSQISHSLALPWFTTSGISIVALLAIQPADSLAQNCAPDPFLSEVCLPESLEPPYKSKDSTKQTVIIPPCFGPCTLFPPAMPYRAFEKDHAQQSTPIGDLTPNPVNAKTTKEESPTMEIKAASTLNINGVNYGEIIKPNTIIQTSNYSRSGINVWARGFGGKTSSAASRHRFADFSSAGSQLGFDIPLSRETRIGLFGTYAAMDGRDGARSSWDTDGWGGGGYAAYRTDSIHVRSMVSAGGYSGAYKRNTSNTTKRGDRSGNAWNGVLSIGAPFDSGNWILEPQALVSYTNTSLDKFSENNTDHDNRLRYEAMEVDQFASELSLKFTRPFRKSDRSLLTPSVRVGWVADWGQTGDSQKVTLIESGGKDRWSLNSETTHGALLELGLEYTTNNFNATSMGVYAKGGGVLWSGDRGASWQASGGINFKF